jgi:predicted nucleic acid-binding Zn ribbon protein
MTRSRKERRHGEPQSISDLVRQVYPSREPADAAAIRVFAWWRRAVPERVYMRARPVLLRGGTLWVHTATSAWSAELTHVKEQLLASVQKHAPEAGVRGIRFRVGPLPELPTSTRPERPRQTPVAVAVLPEPLARALAAIDDDDLREAIGEAASIALGRESER